MISSKSSHFQPKTNFIQSRQQKLINSSDRYSDQGSAFKHLCSESFLAKKHNDLDNQSQKRELQARKERNEMEGQVSLLN